MFRLAILFFALGLAAGAGCQEFVFAQAIDLYGAQGDVGKDYFTGVQVYLDYINATGGINGHKVVFLFKDDGGNPKRTVEITNEFILKSGADALLNYMGDPSVVAVTQSAAFQENKIALFAPLAGGQEATKSNRVFYLRPSYIDEARRIVDFFAGLGISDIAVVYENDAYGRGVANATEAALGKRGGKAVIKTAIAKEPASWQAALRQVAALKPRVLIIAADTVESALLLKQYRPLQPSVFACVLSLVNDKTFRDLGGTAVARGTVVVEVVPNPVRPLIPAVAEHLALMKQYRDEPATQFTLEGYLAAKALVTILRRDGTKPGRANVLAAIQRAREIDVGGFTFDFRQGVERASTFIDLTVLSAKGGLTY
jgi:branched-chain amino acid transport system substrate-binding protein